MAGLVIHQDKIHHMESLIDICPFGALEIMESKLTVNAACKMCRLCVKKSEGVIEYAEDIRPSVDKSLWRGIAVYADHIDGKIHPVTYELIGKAKELARKIGHPVYALIMGEQMGEAARELLHYGVDEVYLYDKPELKRFMIEPYTAVFEDFINIKKPAAVLVGATTVGRQLAPRTAARLKTGLTADCTLLEMSENTDLSQIRPAFGGNIMAHILTPNHRPQMATVRYKVMNAPGRQEEATGKVIPCTIEERLLCTNAEVIDVIPKPREEFIDAADVLVAVGRGVKNQEGIRMAQELAELLNGSIACTRPVAEAGLLPAKCQIGLSGRTVRPKLIITCGISGAIQFTAGMNHSDIIFAINKDEKASIFKTAHYGIVGDFYEIVPQLVAQIKGKRC